MHGVFLYNRPILGESKRKYGSHGRAIGVALALGLIAFIAGCGGGSSASVSEASKEFHNPEGTKGTEQVATFGKESGSAQRAAASAVLAENLAAREEADFNEQCATLGRRGLESVLGSKKAVNPKTISECATTLKGLAEPLPKTISIRKDTLDGEIAALRIDGGKAYALFHGSDGKDYAVPMELEGGSWKVGGILTTELPTEEAKSEPPPKKGA
jgi:hypothetical protein